MEGNSSKNMNPQKKTNKQTETIRMVTISICLAKTLKNNYIATLSDNRNDIQRFSTPHSNYIPFAKPVKPLLPPRVF